MAWWLIFTLARNADLSEDLFTYFALVTQPSVLVLGFVRCSNDRGTLGRLTLITRLWSTSRTESSSVILFNCSSRYIRARLDCCKWHFFPERVIRLKALSLRCFPTLTRRLPPFSRLPAKLLNALHKVPHGLCFKIAISLSVTMQTATRDHQLFIRSKLDIRGEGFYLNNATTKGRSVLGIERVH